jgi:hypothetical protein
VAPAAPPAGSPEALPSSPPLWRSLGNRVIALSLVELRKLRHDRSELCTRAIQPALWLLIFGETFTRLRAIPTGDIPYIDYLAPGILAQARPSPCRCSSNALYPLNVMPTWLRWLSMGNPLSYEVEALRGMLLGTPARLPLDFAVLVAALLAGLTTAALLLPRLAR